MRLILDTETSGLLKPGVPAADPSQPNMVALGAMLVDAQWRVAAKVALLIKPDGWSIEREAEAHHGISESRAAKFGVPAVVALASLRALAANAFQVIAHNAEFDRAVITAELARVGADGSWWAKKAAAMVCTMELSTGPCGLKGQFGPKFPSLEEAHHRFYPGEPYTTRHDAEADMLATSRVAQALQREGLFPALSDRPSAPPILNTWR